LRDSWISSTRSQASAENLQTPFTRNAAAAHQEVLIFGEIPHEVIIFK
jgi:hypothetical protein